MSISNLWNRTRSCITRTSNYTHWLPASLRQLSASSPVPTPPAIDVLPQPGSEEASSVHKWAESFKSMPPESLRNAPGISLSFSRSSGPGGQNVNKVNTKASLTCPLSSHWIPRWAKQDFLKHPYYVQSSHQLRVTSTFTRSQAQNIDDCLAKLKEVILSVATSKLTNATSQETKKRVASHIKAANARMKAEKQQRSSVKQHRSNSRRSGWD